MPMATVPYNPMGSGDQETKTTDRIIAGLDNRIDRLAMRVSDLEGALVKLASEKKAAKERWTLADDSDNALPIGSWSEGARYASYPTRGEAEALLQLLDAGGVSGFHVVSFDAS